MAYYNKVALLIRNETNSEFLVCQKYAHNVTADYIMPGGKNDEGDDLECLRNEIMQELSCRLDESSLEFIGVYEDVAAGRPDRTVEIRLYSGSVIGQPTPNTEIEKLHWISKEDSNNPQVSSIIKNKIIPDLVTRGLLV